MKPIQVMIVVHVCVGLGSLVLTLKTIPPVMIGALAVGWVIAGALFLRTAHRVNVQLEGAAEGVLRALRDAASASVVQSSDLVRAALCLSTDAAGLTTTEPTDLTALDDARGLMLATEADAVLAYRRWEEAGSPSTGPIFDASMRAARAHIEASSRWNDLYDAGISKAEHEASKERDRIIVGILNFPAKEPS